MSVIIRYRGRYTSYYTKTFSFKCTNAREVKEFVLNGLFGGIVQTQ